MISVCMATYNGAAYLPEQLESILSQLHPDDELLISDDGSTDGTCEILAQLKEPQIKVFHNQFRDPVRNFEFTLQQSSKSIICFSDQDDRWLPNKRAVMLRELEPASPQLLLMNGEIINAKGELQAETTFARWGSRSGYWPNLARNTYMGSSMAFTAELKMWLMPFPSSIAMHDWFIGLMAERVGEVKLSEEKTIQYRIHGKNSSLQGSSLADKLRWRYQMWQAVEKRLRERKQ